MTTTQTIPTEATRCARLHWPNYAHIGCFDAPPPMAKQSNRVKKAMGKLEAQCAQVKKTKPKKGKWL